MARRGCREPVTWERLVEALQYAGLVDLADSLRFWDSPVCSYLSLSLLYF